MDQKVQVFSAPIARVLSGTLEEHKDWLEKQLEVPLSQTVTLECPHLFGEAVASAMLGGIMLPPQQSTIQRPWRELIQDWELPAAISPRIQLIRNRERRGKKDEHTTWSVFWQDCPVAIRLRSIGITIIAIKIPVSFPGDRNPANCLEELLVLRRQDVSLVLEAIERELAKHSGLKKTVRSNADSITLAGKYDWQQLVLDPRVTRLVRRDFELFFEREAWFHAHHLPFRRGYLFYGPPGNGKSSVIKVMAAHPAIEPFFINFEACELDDSALFSLFEQAHRSAPSLVIMEDLDRVFPKGKGHARGISFHALVNCLDGIGTQDGLIVAATANDPTALDSAILQRPGRFDRVVAFAPPTAVLRRCYWLSLNPQLSGSGFEHVIQQTQGFSFAQLRETYILAGQLAFEEGREISAEDLGQAVEWQRSGSEELKRARPSQVGFASSHGERHPVA